MLNVDIGRVIYMQYSRNELAPYYFDRLGRKGINAVVDRDAKKLASIKAKTPILRGHGHGANSYGFGFESLNDDQLTSIFNRQIMRNRKRRK